MPLLTPQNKKQSITKLIAKINSNAEVAKRDVNALLTEDLKTELETLRTQQQNLKKKQKTNCIKSIRKTTQTSLDAFWKIQQLRCQCQSNWQRDSR